MAEAIAIFLAIEQAKNLGFTKFLIASNSQQLIKAINSESRSKELHVILHDILYLSSQFEEISFQFVPRAANERADALAKNTLRRFELDVV